MGAGNPKKATPREENRAGDVICPISYQWPGCSKSDHSNLGHPIACARPIQFAVPSYVESDARRKVRWSLSRTCEFHRRTGSAQVPARSGGAIAKVEFVSMNSRSTVL